MTLQEGYQDVSTVISILPVPVSEKKYGLIPSDYSIPAVSDPYSEVEVLLVGRARFPVYIDENRPALIVPEPSDRVAFAICRDYRVGLSHVEPGVSEPGLFWVKAALDKNDVLGARGELKDMLDEARRMQEEWFKRLITDADDYWNKFRARRSISDLQRKAANILGLSREWNLDMEVSDALSTCKFCREQVHPQAIICGHCQGILDMPRYQQTFVKAGSLPATPTPPNA